MTKSIELFSTREDALQLLAEIETKRPLWYVKTGTYSLPTCQVHTSATQISQLGITLHADRASSDRYMIFPSQVELAFRDVKQNTGTTLYMLDAWKNPPCLVFICGGVYEGDDPQADGCLVAGLVETAYKDAAIGGLYSLFARSIKKLYTRIERPELDSFIGPAAMGLLRSGWRLTESCSAPPDLDLRLPYDCVNLRPK